MKGIFFSIWRLPSAASILALVLLLGSCSNVDNVYDSMRRIESDDAPAYNSVRLEQLQLDSVRYSGESFSWAQEGQGICCSAATTFWTPATAVISALCPRSNRRDRDPMRKIYCLDAYSVNIQ